MDVGAQRQVGMVDLHHRPDHDDRPFGMGIGDRRDELQVHPLVDDSVEAEPRAADRPLIVGDRVHRAGLGEMAAVDAGREGVDVGVTVLLRLIEAVAAGEDDVGGVDQLLLEGKELRRGEAEIGELVHAVVDGAGRLHVPREGQHHRRVIPTDERPLLAGQEGVEQGLQSRFALVFREGLGERRGDDDDIGLGAGANTQSRLHLGERSFRLLPENHPPVAGEAAHQMLGPLKYKVPPQVRETDQRVVVGQ